MKDKQEKRKQRWAEWKPAVMAFGICATVTGAVFLVVRDGVQKDMIKDLSTDNKRLKKDLVETEDVAWDWHDFSMALLAKQKATPNEMADMAQSWGQTRSIA